MVCEEGNWKTINEVGERKGERVKAICLPMYQGREEINRRLFDWLQSFFNRGHFSNLCMYAAESSKELYIVVMSVRLKLQINVCWLLNVPATG